MERAEGVQMQNLLQYYAMPPKTLWQEILRIFCFHAFKHVGPWQDRDYSRLFTSNFGSSMNFSGHLMPSLSNSFGSSAKAWPHEPLICKITAQVSKGTVCSMTYERLNA